MKTLGKTPKKLTDYTREDYNRIFNKKQPNKKGDGLYNNALNSRKYNVADREREKEGLYKPQMADHSREVSPAIKSYMKKKGITDVNEAKKRYAKGEALVKKQQQKAKEAVPKRQNVDLGTKLESRGAGTLDNGFGSASIKRVTREAPTQKPSLKDMKKGVKTMIKAERKDNRLQKKNERQTARQESKAAKSLGRNAAQTARAEGKAALKEAKTASKAQRITDKYNKKISKLKGANIAACGGKMKKK